MGLLAILISINVLLLIIFRQFKVYKVDTFQAIVFNYLTCVIVGSITLGKFPLSVESIDKEWFPYAILLGILFIFGFNVLARTVQNFGITLTSIAQKMSLILSVGFAIIYFNESINLYKIVGILTAIGVIILINFPRKQKEVEDIHLAKLWYLLLLTWLISGIIEALLFYVEAMDYSSNADIGFVVGLFGMAAIIGSVIMVIGWITRRLKFNWKNLLAGVILGVPNFFTIYLLLVLINNGQEGSVIFPILNVSIILGSALIGFLVFKEKLSKIQWIGFLLGISCIILIALS